MTSTGPRDSPEPAQPSQEGHPGAPHCDARACGDAGAESGAARHDSTRREATASAAPRGASRAQGLPKRPSSAP